MEGKTLSYFANITSAIGSLAEGLRLTFDHLVKARKNRKPVAVQGSNYFERTEGINTVRFPHEMQPIPDNGRYRLHNEIDDCIVCDKCAKICPVDCITIEPVKAVAEFGKTSDGTPKRIYAAKFDIDMGKCCFCGLCTTVCPTECLTMTKVFDYSVYDMNDHNFSFADMLAEEVELKKKELEAFQKLKAEKQVTPPVQTPPSPEPAADGGKPEVAKPAKPVFRPKIKPAGPPPA